MPPGFALEENSDGGRFFAITKDSVCRGDAV